MKKAAKKGFTCFAGFGQPSPWVVYLLPIYHDMAGLDQPLHVYLVLLKVIR